MSIKETLALFLIGGLLLVLLLGLVRLEKELGEVKKEPVTFEIERATIYLDPDAEFILKAEKMEARPVKKGKKK